MNIATASKMLALLEQSQHEGPEDDTYFIVHRLLTSEIRRGADPKLLHAARVEFLKATREEILLWLGNKVAAMRAYRERTGSGLYEAKKALEAGEEEVERVMGGLRMDSESPDIRTSLGVTSCG
jgi:hypothetical protein